jgi:maleylacetoacetate isomerase
VKLFTYFRSSAAWRVRIALHLKGVAWEPAFVHLLKDGGEQHGAAFRATNKLGLVPALETDAGDVLTQSLAIIEWLEETHPAPPLLPADPVSRARVRAFALAIACDIHPLDNLRVLRYLKRDLGQPQPAIDAWYRHWIAAGLPALEAALARQGDGGPWCFGPEPGLADVVLIPQLANARRLDCPLGDFPLLLRAEAAASGHPAFVAAAPAVQGDAS